MFFYGHASGKNTVTRLFCPTMQGIVKTPGIPSIFGK